MQSFIEKKVLSGRLIAGADRKRGKFRHLLRRSLLNHVRDMMRSEPRQSEDIADHTDRLVARDHAADVFDLAWAREVVSKTLRRMQAECEAKDHSAYWRLFECRVLGPTLDGIKSPGYEELVGKFGFRSPQEGCNALLTAKRMFVRALHSVVGEYASNEEEVSEEIRELRAILSRSGAS